MAFFLFADQNLMAPNLKNIGRSLGLENQTDIDTYLGGVVPACFFILGGLVSISMGYLSQQFSRKHLLIGAVILGELPCFLTGFASSYTEFLIYRTLCGFGLGGVFPILFSILGDYFSTKSRVIATGYISLAMGLGISIGQLVGGILGQADPENGWRTSFFVLSIPSFIFVALYALFCSEPIRGGSEQELKNVLDIQDEHSHKLKWNEVKELFKIPSNVAIFLQGIPGCVPWGVFFVFLVDYYESAYMMSKITASGYLTFAALGLMVGTFSGGIIGQKLYNKKKTYLPIFGMSSILLGIFPCYVLLHAGDFSLSWFFAPFNFLTGIIIAFPISNIRSMLINVNLPKTRSAAFALYNLTDDLGKGLGPALSALILGLIPDRSIAFTVSILFWIPCALLWLPIIRNFSKDEEMVHVILTEKAKELSQKLS
jgi:MFS family permease